MANNKAIKILRTTTQGITDSIKDVELLEGQPFYNKQKNYLTVGHIDTQGTVKQKPITVREVVGYFDDTSDTIGSGQNNTYSIQPSSDNNSLNIQSSKNLNIQGNANLSLNAGIDVVIQANQGNGNYTLKSKNINIESTSGESKIRLENSNNKFAELNVDNISSTTLLSDLPITISKQFVTQDAQGNITGSTTKSTLKLDDNTITLKNSSGNIEISDAKFKLTSNDTGLQLSYPVNQTDNYYLIKDNKIQADKVYFSQPIMTSYPIGSVQDVNSGKRETLFNTTDSLETQLNNIFDPTINPEITEPSISIQVNGTLNSGEIGNKWQFNGSSSVRITENSGNFQFGPNTGVIFYEETGQNQAALAALDVVETDASGGGSSGPYGEGNPIYPLSPSYNTVTMKQGNQESSEQSLGTLGGAKYGGGLVTINAAWSYSNSKYYAKNNKETSIKFEEYYIKEGTATDTLTIGDKPLYRHFYGFVGGTNISSILEQLKGTKQNTNELKTDLYSSGANPESITIKSIEPGYIYFITTGQINKATMSGFEFPIIRVLIGTNNMWEFTNSYEAKYQVYVYKSKNEQTAGTYTIELY